MSLGGGETVRRRAGLQYQFIDMPRRTRVTVIASDGKQARISWYDGATEGAVTRCARIALGLPAYGTAHLVSPSGDIVNFGKPIEDGVTLYLEAVPRAHDPPALDGGAWSRRGILIKAGYRHDHGTTTTTWQQQQQADPSVPSHPRPLPPGTLQHPAPRLENGDYEEEGGETDHSSSSPEPADHTDDGSVSMNTTRQRIFSSWRSGPQKALQKDSTDDERRPLLTSAVSSESNASMNDAQPTGEINSSEDHNHDHHLHRRKFKSYSHGEGEHRQNRWGTLLEPSSSSRAGSGRVGGGSSGDCRRTVSGSGGDAFGNDETPAGQRGSIVKMKRINAHLASERTYLAWVRAMGKLFTAGTLSLTLASNTSGSYSVCFVLVGLVYFALCPYVVFVGLRRYHEAAEVMQGTVHEAYSFYMGRDLKGVSLLLSALSALSVLIMSVELFALI